MPPIASPAFFHALVQVVVLGPKLLEDEVDDHPVDVVTAEVRVAGCRADLVERVAPGSRRRRDTQDRDVARTAAEIEHDDVVDVFGGPKHAAADAETPTRVPP